MGIAAYNRGTRAISAYITQQSIERRTVKPRPILHPKEERDFRAMGRRVRVAINARDFATAQSENRAFLEAIALEPEQFRKEATRVMREAWAEIKPFPTFNPASVP